MKPKPHSSFFLRLLLSLFFASSLAGVGLAQSSPTLAGLNIALWPEYDRPEVLVIFRGRVEDSALLPAPVSFNLPGAIEAMHAVAYFDEERGTLVNVAAYDFAAGADGKTLSFTVPARQFQFEYYSSDTLSINGSVRELSFSYTSSVDIASLSFELQQPPTAQAFTSDPPPSITQVRQDGLTYALYQVGAVSAGDSHSLQASYTRRTHRWPACDSSRSLSGCLPRSLSLWLVWVWPNSVFVCSRFWPRQDCLV